jgi:hypothetical protein
MAEISGGFTLDNKISLVAKKLGQKNWAEENKNFQSEILASSRRAAAAASELLLKVHGWCQGHTRAKSVPQLRGGYRQPWGTWAGRSTRW